MPSVGGGIFVASGTSGNPAVPVYNLTPNALPIFRLAVANAQSGLARSKILFVGTSQTRGTGLTNQDIQNIPAAFMTLLNKLVAPTQLGLNGLDPADTPTNPRWAIGSGYTFPSTFGFAGVSNMVASTAAVGTAVFTPGIFNGSVDTFDFYTVGDTLTGVSHVAFSGGVVQNNNTNAGSPTVQKWTIAGAAATTNFLTISAPGTFNVRYIGVEPYLSTQLGLLVGNAAINGIGNSTNWAKTGAGLSIPSIAAYQPALVIAEIDIDDAAGAGISAGQYAANMTSFIQSIRALPADLMFYSSARPNTGSGFSDALTVLYAQVMASLAAQYAIPFVDIQGRMGPFNGGWGTQGFSLGAVHFNQPGCNDVASALANALIAVL